MMPVLKMPVQCIDGKDNDGDGKADCTDDNCKLVKVCGGKGYHPKKGKCGSRPGRPGTSATTARTTTATQ